MTDEKIPTLDEIETAFYKHCACPDCNYDCDYCVNCDYAMGNTVCNGGGDLMGECLNQYIYDIATGSRDIAEEFHIIPKWCEVGNYVAVRGDYLKYDCEFREYLNDDEWYCGKIEAIDLTSPSEVTLDFGLAVLDEPLGAFINEDNESVIPLTAPIPKWFKVGAKLWRKSFNDWYAIKSLTPAEEIDEEGNALFVLEMVASDGSEDEAKLPYSAFDTKSPFPDWFLRNIKKPFWHKGREQWLRVDDYFYDSNDVALSYQDDNGTIFIVQEEFNSENFSIEKPKPKYRPYTFEEAEQLLGKKMKWHLNDWQASAIITEVVEEHGDVKINDIFQSHFFATSATIDGEPFGVRID